MAGGSRDRYWGRTDPRSPEEVIAFGKRVGVPEISWGWNWDMAAYQVVYHWDHGDTVIYPTLNGRETMTYEPQPGDIGLVSMPGRVGWLIKVGQWLAGDGWTDLQHAFVVAGHDDRLPGVRIVEAMPGGALNSSLSRYADQKVVWLRCPPAYRAAVARAALHLVGTPYSFLDYGALALHRFRIPAPHLRSYISDKGHQICSQLADSAAAEGGWHIFSDQRWHGAVTPNDLGKVAAMQRPGEYIERAKVSR